MPDRDYYLSTIRISSRLRAKYLDHLTKMLTLAGEANAAARAKAIMDFETAIAKVSWTREDVGDATKTYNKMTLAAAARSSRRASTCGELSQGAVGQTSSRCSSPSRARSRRSPR